MIRFRRVWDGALGRLRLLGQYQHRVGTFDRDARVAIRKIQEPIVADATIPWG